MRHLAAHQLLMIARRDAARQTRLGDTQSWLELADRAWTAGLTAVMEKAFVPTEVTVRKLIEVGTTLQVAAIAAFQRGHHAAGEAITELSARTAAAISEIGKAISDILAEMIGGKPMDFAWIGAGLVVLLGAGLFLTPGGQIVLQQLPSLLPAWGPR